MTDYSSYQLSGILRACSQGQRAAQKELYQRFFSYGLTVCMHYARSREEAEELVHDGFVKVFQKIDQLQEPALFRAWFRRILVRIAIDHFRRRAKQIKVQAQSIQEQSAHAENHVHRQLEKEDVIHLLQGLSDRYRLVFNLYVIEDYSHEDIAKALQISVGTSKSNLSRAKQQLRKLLLNNKLLQAKYGSHENT